MLCVGVVHDTASIHFVLLVLVDCYFCQDLLNKMKDGTSAPQRVDRQIRELDKLVKRIRHKRYVAQKSVNEDKARIAVLDEQINRIHRTSYDPLKEACQQKVR